MLAGFQQEAFQTPKKTRKTRGLGAFDAELLAQMAEYITTKSELKGLEPEYLLEALSFSNQKYNAEFLNRQFLIWMEERKKGLHEQKFFAWLEAKIPNSQPIQRIYYASPVEREARFRLQLDEKKGSLINQGRVFDSAGFVGKKTGYAAYAMDVKVTAEGKSEPALYAAEHGSVVGDGAVLRHSTFLAGKKPQCAGMVKIDNGLIVDIDNNSGHYQPKLPELYKAVKLLPLQMFAPHATVTFHIPLFPGLISNLKNSSSGFLRLLGRALNKVCVKKVSLTPEKFLKFAETQLPQQTEEKPVVEQVNQTPILDQLMQATPTSQKVVQQDNGVENESNEKVSYAPLFAKTDDEPAVCRRLDFTAELDEEDEIKSENENVSSFESPIASVR